MIGRENTFLLIINILVECSWLSLGYHSKGIKNWITIMHPNDIEEMILFKEIYVSV